MAVQNQFIQVANDSMESASGWIYLVDWILILILGIAFVFYFGRLAGWLLSLILQVVMWKMYHVMVNVESIRISILGGRIMLKNLVITTEDSTTSVLRLNLTWRYWLSGDTRLCEYAIDVDAEKMEAQNKVSENEKLTSRLLLVLEGLEIFTYNRTFAYDHILETLMKEESAEKTNDDDNDDDDNNNNNSTMKHRMRGHTDSVENSLNSSSKSELSSLDHDEVDVEKLFTKLKWLLRIFPISIIIKKAAMVYGNKTTPTLLVASCKSANGIVDVKKSASSLDIFKHLALYELENLQVSMKPNILYDKAGDKQSFSTNAESVSRFKALQRKLNVIPSLYSRIVKRKPSIQVNYQNWIGLRRYIGESMDDFNNLFDNLSEVEEEYAKYSLILDCKMAKIGFYYDIPGIAREFDTSSPEYGMDIELSMATIHYGAWADKQRVPLQSAFFPSIARDSEPTKPVAPGQLRTYNGFKINVITNDEIILRVPTRESSKDKGFLKKNLNSSANNQNKQVRPFGWIELKMGPNSSMSLYSSFVCLENGWLNKVSTVFMKPELSTSVNHDILFLADLHTLNADISFPLKWNDPYEWTFDNYSSKSKIFFLREHVELFSDIFTDFGSGPPVPYEDFKPCKYIFNWNLHKYKFYLNLNDSNIINNALDFSSNKYLSVQGEEFKANVNIPLLGQFTRVTTVDFHLFAPRFDLVLDLPSWHTANAFIKPSNIIGQSSNFTIDGSYTYLSSIEVQTCNNIIIKTKGDDVMLKFYGSLIKYIFVIRENYLADDFHFKTFDEYNDELNNNKKSNLDEDSSIQEEFDYWKMVKTDNNVDVLFTFLVRKGLLLLPHDLYGCKNHIGLTFDYFDTDIRFTNFYMDMQADLSSIYGKMVHLDMDEDKALCDINKYVYQHQLRNNPHLYLSELTVHGHRMFGIPPLEITYYCNWRVATDALVINGPPNFLTDFGNTITSLGLSFNDLENSLVPGMPTVYDTIFFTFDCPSIQINTIYDDKCSSLVLNSLLMTFNDKANKRYTSKMSLNIPEIIWKVTDADKLTALFRTSLKFDLIGRKPDYNRHRKLQQEHIRFNDAPFHRSPFLLFEDTKNENYNDGYCSMIVPMTLPDVALPLNRYTDKIYKDQNSSTTSLNTFSSTSSYSTIDEQDLFISPTLRYVEDDFEPESQTDPKFKYDNTICTFSEVIGYISPSAIHIIAGIFERASSPDFSTIMDSFEKHIITSLKKSMDEVCMDDNFRLVAPVIDITFGEFDGTNEREVTASVKKNPNINVFITEPSVALSDRVKRWKLDKEFFTEKDCSLALSVKSMAINIYNPQDSMIPINVTVNETEVWLTTQDDCDVLSINVEDISVKLGDSQLIWLVSYLGKLHKELDPSFELMTHVSKMEKRVTAALIYKLSIASKEFKVDHDPEVLTRPAYLIRSLDEHIRFIDTWVVLIKLRHIFHNMSDQWITDEQEALNNCCWDVPKTAYDRSWDIFSKWRSWEANIGLREAFFQLIFNIKPLFEKKLITKTLITQASIEVSEGNTIGCDTVILDDIHLTMNDRKSITMFLKTDHDINEELDATIKATEFLFNLGEYKSAISSITLKLIPELMSLLSNNDSKPNITAAPTDPGIHNTALFFMINLNSVDQKLILDYSSFDIFSMNFNVSAMIQTGEAETYSSVTTKCDLFNFIVRMSNEILLSHKCEMFNSIIGGGKNLETPFFLDVFVENSTTELRSKKLSESLEKFKKDMKYIEMFTNDSSQTAAPSPAAPKSTSNLNFKEMLSYDVILNIQVNHYSWTIDIFQPFVLNGAIYDNSFSLILTEGILDISSLLQKADFYVKVNKSRLLEVEHSQLFNNFKFVDGGDKYPRVFIDSQIGFSKTLIPKLFKSVDDLFDQAEEIKEEIEALMKVFKSFELKQVEQLTKPEATQEKFDLLLIPVDLKFSNDYISFSVLVDRSKYSLELEDLDLKAGNIVNDKLDSFTGSLLLPVTRLSLTSRTIPVGLSNVFDFNMLIKIINDNTPTGSGRKILEILSQHCRMCLSLGVVERFVILADSVTILMKKAEKEFKKRHWDSILGNDGKNNDKILKEEDDFSLFKSISGIHFLAYKFCIGWIFEDPRKDYPGLILGAEKFYAVTDEHMGKLSLMEAYLAVAHGSTSSSFFSPRSERTSYNRAFLPFMQFIYIITEKADNKDMKISITGEQLDVNYLSNAIHILEAGIKSGSSVQAFFDQRTRPIDQWKDDTKTTEEQNVDYINSLRSTYSSIECKATFAGSTVVIHKPSTLGSSSDEGSLVLTFPAVKSMTTYIHDKIGAKKHNIKWEMFTSSSDNKLHSSCVPVLVDILEGTKRMMKAQPQPQQNQVPKKNETVRLFNFSSLLEETDFHFGLTIDSQRVSLSCEPTAKVEAIVGIGGINIQCNSGVKASIDLAVNLLSIAASLQHIYSREISGSVGIDSIVVSTNIDFIENVDIKSAGSISDVSGYVNVKQYQDLALFKDIWVPSSSFTVDNEEGGTEDGNNQLASNKSIASRFKEVSTTNAIPWFITFLLQRVAIKVNCGPSLGEMLFKLDQFWIVSTKTPDWTQRLKVGIDYFELSSEGRLGGKFFGSDIYLHSEIDWKVEDGSVLDVPLILVSSGIDKLTIKSTFDYHMFAVVNIDDFSIDVFNQKNELSIIKDHLFVTAQFKNFEVFVTSFTASNVMDIYNTILRMTQDNRISYKETLHDSNKHARSSEGSNDYLNNAILETVKKLETEFEVIAGRLLIQVYPSSFDDTKVLVMKLDESRAIFMQNEYNSGISNQLDILFNDLTVSLSMNTPVPENFIQEITVEEFSKYANKARGGNLFLFPSFQISMKTFQGYESNLVEYLYKSTFGGTVEIRWNLGSVNFIREMYSIHTKSLESRTEFRKSFKSNKTGQIDFKENIFSHEKPSKDSPLIDPHSNINTEQIDQAINEKISKVSEASKYEYIPLAPPIIQAPQLKELGNATPPLEWFGLHRNKFPNVTHELGIVNLQKVIHQVESEYSRILGRA